MPAMTPLVSEVKLVVIQTCCYENLCAEIHTRCDYFEGDYYWSLLKQAQGFTAVTRRVP